MPRVRPSPRHPSRPETLKAAFVRARPKTAWRSRLGTSRSRAAGHEPDGECACASTVAAPAPSSFRSVARPAVHTRSTRFEVCEPSTFPVQQVRAFHACLPTASARPYGCRQPRPKRRVVVRYGARMESDHPDRKLDEGVTQTISPARRPVEPGGGWRCVSALRAPRGGLAEGRVEQRPTADRGAYRRVVGEPDARSRTCADMV